MTGKATLSSPGAGSAAHFGRRAATGAFTLIEVTVSLAIIAFAMALVAQLGYWSMRERDRNAARAVALELAANVMEQARALPWEAISSEWAANQQVPSSMRSLLPGAKLSVKVEPVASLPYTKRVGVDVRWMYTGTIEARPVRLVSLFSARNATR